MKTKNLCPLALLLAIAGCSRQEYDISNGVNKEVTLFNEQITVPVGSIGPIQLKEIMKLELVTSLVGDNMRIADDGVVWLESQSELYSVNGYALAMKAPRLGEPFTYEAGSASNSSSGLAGTLSFLGLGIANQHVTVKVLNPIMDDTAVHGTLKVFCRNWSTYEQTYSASKSLEGTTLPSSGNPIVLADFDIPGSDCLGGVELQGLKLDLPARLENNVRSSNQNFLFTYTHRGNIAVKGSFSIELPFPLNNLNLPVAQYNLHAFDVAMVLSNTLPIDVTIAEITLLNPDGSDNMDVQISGDIHLAAGSLAVPSESNIQLHVQALEGTVPDIAGLTIKLALQGDPAFESEVLSVNQGISIKSSSVTLSGGITLDLNSHDEDE